MEQISSPLMIKITELQKSLGLLRDALDYQRILIKYSQFDLEATRRERDQLQEKLEHSLKACDYYRKALAAQQKVVLEIQRERDALKGRLSRYEGQNS